MLSGCSRYLVLRQMSHQRLWLLVFWCLHGAASSGPSEVWGESSSSPVCVGTKWWWFMLVACPDLLVAWMLWCRLASEELGRHDEMAFVAVSAIHLAASGVANVSLICKQRRQSLKSWLFEVLAILALEVASACIALVRVATFWGLSLVPFGGEHLVSFLFSSSMGISMLVMLLQLPELISAIFKPVGWSDCLQPASRRLAILARTIEAWIREVARDQPRRVVVVPRPPAAPRPIVKWPPKLPTNGPPLTPDELDVLSFRHPHLVCPVSHALPLEPAVGTSGATFDRPSIEAALRATGKDPVSNAPCAVHDLRPNYALRAVIDDYVDALRTPDSPPLSRRSKQRSKRQRNTYFDDPPSKRLRPLPSRRRKRQTE